MSWQYNNYGGHHPFQGSSQSGEDKVQEALRNVHISEDEEMRITMQEREAAEVLLQMGGLNRSLGGSGPQRKSVITATRSALQQESLLLPISKSGGGQNENWNATGGTNYQVYQQQYQAPVPSSGGTGGISLLAQIMKNQDHVSLSPIRSQPCSQIPISVVQRQDTIRNFSKGNQNLQATSSSNNPKPELVQKLGSVARVERQLSLFEPTVAVASNKKQTTSSSNSQHQIVGQIVPQLPPRPSHFVDGGVIQILSPTVGPRSGASSATSLLLPVAGVGGTFIQLKPSMPPIMPMSSKPAALNLNIGGPSSSTLSSSIFSSSQTAGGSGGLSYNPILNLTRNNSHILNNNNYSSSPSNATISSEQILRKKKEEKKLLRARVPLNKDASKDIEVDGFIIPREFWAKSFVQADICHAAGILFKALFSQEEIQKCTLRGRNGTSLLNVQKRSAIFRAVGWMKHKNQNPYSFNSSETLSQAYQLSHEEKMIIEKKVFVERRYQTSRKIRDYQRPKNRRANNNKNQQQEFLSNPKNIPPELAQSLSYEQSSKIEEIVVKPEPVDVDYYEGDHSSGGAGIMNYGTTEVSPPSHPYIKKEIVDTDQIGNSHSSQSRNNFIPEEYTTDYKPTSPKQPKLDTHK